MNTNWRTANSSSKDANSVPGNLYIDVPQQVQDEQITVLAVLLDGPIKLYRGVGQVQDNN